MLLSLQGLEALPQLLLWMVAALVFIFAACIGSFLNVVIYRLPIMLERQWKAEARQCLDMPLDEEQAQHFNLAFPRSACPSCSAIIPFWHNIPLLSYLILGGKCASCKQSISLRYPLVELVAGCLALMLLFLFGLTWQFAAILSFAFVCMALFGIDVDKHLLPDVLTLPLVWLGLVVNSFSIFATLQDSLYGAVFGYGVLWAVFWLFKLVTGKDGMGYGDFKLLAAFGAWFGWMILPNTILLSSLLGALIGGVALWRNGKDSQTPIAFGPFIILAGFLTVLFPQYFSIFTWLR